MLDNIFVLSNDFEPIAVSHDIKKLIEFLISDKHVNKDTQIYHKFNDKYCSLYSAFGETWQQELLNMSVGDFNIAFDHEYEITDVPVVDYFT